MEKINIKEKFSLFTEHWSPKILGEIENLYIKVAKFQGEFEMHKHNNEDEMFLVVEGSFVLRFVDREIEVNKGEFIVVPKGVCHSPYAKDEVQVMLFEPKTTINTGDEINERTVINIESI